MENSLRISGQEFLTEIPSYYITEEELDLILKEYKQSIDQLQEKVENMQEIVENISAYIDDTPVTMVNNGQLSLTKTANDKIGLKVEIYKEPIARISINPTTIEYDRDYLPNPAIITISASLEDRQRMKSMRITGGNLFNEDVQSLQSITDVVSNTIPTIYKLIYVTDRDVTKTQSVETTITRRVLYGSTKPTIENFFSYPYNVKQIVDSNPQVITTIQNDREYCYFATPIKVTSFTDTEVGLPGGWIEEPEIMISPYSDGKPYYIYKTKNHSLGTITWQIK